MNKPLIINMDLANQHYPIYIGSDLLINAELLQSAISGSQVLIISNAKIAELYLAKLKKVYQNLQCDHVLLPDGEQYKNLDTVNLIFNALVEKKHRRNTTLLALGGGVIGDMTGFAAACYMRGVNYLQFPTTLLAQVDASVGGKTGVNHPLGKNMIGAFYQPNAVFIDITTLQSLPDRVFHEGFAEIIKYGLIQDAEFFNWLQQNANNLLQKDKTCLEWAIKRSCEIKAALVMADEREQGVRAFLNFGHTFGHAIESCLGYGSWLHGEAVAIGMLLATDLSIQMGYLEKDVLQRLTQLLKTFHLPITLPKTLNIDSLLDSITRDKKNIQGKNRFILLNGVGQAIIDDTVPLEKLTKLVTDWSQKT